MNRLSKRDRRALLLGAVVLVPILLYTTVLRPYRSAVDSVRGRVEMQRKLLAREHGLLAMSDSIPEVIRATVQGVSELRARLLPTSDRTLAEAELTSYLERLATANRVLLREMRASGGHAAGPLAAMPAAVRPIRNQAGAAGPLEPIRVVVSAESDFEGITSFLNRIEDGRLLVRVVELTLESTRESTSGPARANARQSAGQVLSLSMVIEAYAPAAVMAAPSAIIKDTES